MKVTLDLEDVQWLLGEARGAFRLVQGQLGGVIPSICSEDAVRINRIDMDVAQQVQEHEQRTDTSRSDAAAEEEHY